jgi:hypothetical protein
MIFAADLIACRLNSFMSAVARRSVTPRLWSGFLVWLLYMVPVAPSRIVLGVYGVQVSEALAADVVLVPFLLVE